MPRVAIVITSHDRLGDTGKSTGYWLEELAAPYYAFKDAGFDLTLASPNGGKPPLDPGSAGDDHQNETTRKFEKDEEAQKQLSETVKTATLEHQQFDAVFFPGGHGPLWDLVDDEKIKNLIQEMLINEGKPVAAVCHAPAVLCQAMTADGKSIVSDHKVTGFTDAEEEAVGLTKVVPFLLEERLKGLGGKFEKSDEPWSPHVVVDTVGKGTLITGQNPASSEGVAKALIEALKK